MLEGVPFLPMLPAADLGRARTWYQEKLGLAPKVEMEEQEFLAYESFVVYRSQYAGTAKNTAASWFVADAGQIIDHLRSRGVRFEEYDMPELSWKDGVASDPSGQRIVWFKDSEDNILSVGEVPPEMLPS